jgi:hypothetical protein
LCEIAGLQLSANKLPFRFASAGVRRPLAVIGFLVDAMRLGHFKMLQKTRINSMFA